MARNIVLQQSLDFDIFGNKENVVFGTSIFVGFIIAKIQSCVRLAERRSRILS